MISQAKSFTATPILTQTHGQLCLGAVRFAGETSVARCDWSFLTSGGDLASQFERNQP